MSETPEIITYSNYSFHNYKIKLPKLKDKYSHSLLNVDELHNFIGGDVWICLWFRHSGCKWGNQISLEYNRFTNEPLIENGSNGNSKGKFFVESYFPVELTPFIIKSLKVFQRIIAKKDNGHITNRGEFLKIVEDYFKEEEDGIQQKIT